MQRKWSNLFEHADLFIAGMVGAALSAPGYTFADIDDWMAGQQLSARQLVPEIMKQDSKTLGGHFAVFMRSDEFLRELVARVRPLAL